MSPVGRPSTLPIKKLIHMDEEMLDAIDAYRANEKPIPNQSEAIRRLLRKQLIALGCLKDEPDT